MATAQNSGSAPNIVDIQFGCLEDGSNKKQKSSNLLGNFKGEVQIKGKYDMNKLLSSILKNEDKPVILCMQFKDPQMAEPTTRNIYLQTTYRMCSPVQSPNPTSEPNAADQTASNTSMSANPSKNDKGQNKKSKYKKTQKPDKNGNLPPKFTICEQLQNLLFPCQRKQSNVPGRENNNDTDNSKEKQNNYERERGDGRHISSPKRQKDKYEESEQQLKARDLGEIEIEGRRFGAIFYDDGKGTGREESEPPAQRKTVNGNNKWLLEEGAQDLGRNKWNIPEWVPADTICRCNRYFPDGKCKCHEYLKKIGKKGTGPRYVPQGEQLVSSQDQPVHGNEKDEDGKRTSKHGEEPYKNNSLNRTGSQPDNNNNVIQNQRTKDENVYKRGESKPPVRIKESEDERKNQPPYTMRDGQENTNTKPEEQPFCKCGPPREIMFCKCGYLPDEKYCKCKIRKYEPGKGPSKNLKYEPEKEPPKNLKYEPEKEPPKNSMHDPGKGTPKKISPNDQARKESVRKILPCVSKGIATVDGRQYTAELIICDENGLDGARRKSPTRVRDTRQPTRSGDKNKRRPNGYDSRAGQNVWQNNAEKSDYPSRPDKGLKTGPGEVVIVPGKQPIVTIPGDGNYPEDLTENPPNRFYCGCTGLWIEYYPKKTEKPEPSQPPPPPMEEPPPTEGKPIPPGADLIPGFSFMLESCTLELDEDQNPTDKECLIRTHEIHRFKQSGYKNQPLTLIMNDPYSTPLRIYEVSVLEGKRYISAQVE